MKNPLSRVLRAFLWGICAFHVIVGLGLNASPQFALTMASYYGAQLTPSPDFIYILKPLGVFMFALGVLAAVAARNPLEHAAVVYAFVIVFLARALQRLVFRQEIHEVFAIDPGRNIANSVFFFAMAIALLVLYRAVTKGSQASGAR